MPFSSGLSMPIGRKAAEWIYLKNKAEKIRQRDHEEDCRKWAKEHGIGEINTSNLFCIPDRGMEVINRFGEIHKEYPVDTNLEGIDRIGMYGTNNGILALVNADGKTYITKGYSLVKELEEKGFKETGIHGALSNGEEIIDPILAAEWDHVIRK